MKINLRIYIMCQLVLAISAGFGLKAQTLLVTPGGAGLKNGSSWANALDSVGFRAALRSAVKGDTFWVAQGLYTPANNRDSSFIINSGVKIYGGFGGFELALDQRDWTYYITTLSGDIGANGINTDNCYHVLRVANVDTGTVIDGFIISHGNADLAHTAQMYGGGIYATAHGHNSHLLIANCTLNSNVAYNGGSMSCGATTGDTLSVQLINCTFNYNTAFSGGGALYNSADSGVCSIDISRCLLNNNFVILDSFNNTGGGAIMCLSTRKGVTTTSVSNSLLFNNAADSAGGAMFSVTNGAKCITNIINTTIADNMGGQGGALSARAYNSGTCRINATNSIFWNDTATVLGNEIDTLNATATLTYCDVRGGFNGAHNQNAQPLFYDENMQDYRILPCSPLIDSGTLTGAPAVDLLGNKRPVSGAIDLGAYEYQGKSGNSLLPSVTLFASPGTQVCASIKSITFLANPVFGGDKPTYTWKKNNIVVTGIDSAYVDTAIKSGDKVLVIIKSNSACLHDSTATSTADSITQAPLPKVNTGRAAGNIVCLGIGRRVGGPINFGYGYKWTPSAGLSADSISAPFANPSTTTTYTLTVIDSLTGCLNHDTITLRVDSLPHAFAGGNKAVCYGTPTAIGTSATSNYVYNWFPATGLSSTTASNPVATITKASKYRLLVTNNISKCQSEDSISLSVTSLPAVSVGSNDTVCTGTLVTLSATAGKGVSYSWSPASGLNSSTVSNPSVTVTKSAYYYVKVTDSTTKCASTDSILVLVRPFYTMGLINVHYNKYWATYYPGVSYYWSVSQYDSLTKGQGTDTLTVTWMAGHSTSKATIKVYALVPCSDTATLSANVGMNDIDLSGVHIEVYPNPAGSFITLSMGNTSGVALTATLTDLTGRHIKSLFTQFTGTQYTVNLDGLSAGLYLLRVTDDKGETVVRRISVLR